IFIPLPEHLRDGASPELNARSVIWDLETIAQRRGTQQQIIAALGRINREYRDYSENDLTRIRALLEGLKSFGKNNEGYEWVRSYAAQLWDEIDFLLLTRANKKNRHYRWNVLLIYKSN
ncbi:MAG: hypothetical protein JW725_05645, partial [Candidatus Babeliaceae bacterium]|nr:hypothetical protein [Candidatus Babeliaceae bacterium]